MRPEDEELDYLVPAQLETKPFTFERLVKEAFLIEHGCKTQLEIAEVLGVDKSRITQIFGNPKNLKVETIQALLEPLQNQNRKRRILAAWNRECFDIDFIPKSSIALRGPVGPKHLKRVDRYFREMRYSDAANVATHAAELCEGVIQQQFLDRAFHAWLWLDMPGSAMEIAHKICETSRSLNEPSRMTMAHLHRVKVLMELRDSEIGDLVAILDVAAHFAAKSATVKQKDRLYQVAGPERVKMYRESVQLWMFETGRTPLKEGVVRQILEDALASFNKGASYQVKFTMHLHIARLYFLLGETFQAREHVDLAYKSGQMANLGALERCGYLTVRIMELTEPPERVATMYAKLSGLCGRSQHLAKQRQVEERLAHVVNGLIDNSLT